MPTPWLGEGCKPPPPSLHTRLIPPASPAYSTCCYLLPCQHNAYHCIHVLLTGPESWEALSRQTRRHSPHPAGAAAVPAGPQEVHHLPPQPAVPQAHDWSCLTLSRVSRSRSHSLGRVTSEHRKRGGPRARPRYASVEREDRGRRRREEEEEEEEEESLFREERKMPRTIA